MKIAFRNKILTTPMAAGFALISTLPLVVNTASAVEFSLLDGQISGTLDTTISYGQTWRVQGRDKNYDAADINSNDGNRNFDTGLASEVFKATSDLGRR